MSSLKLEKICKNFTQAAEKIEVLRGIDLEIQKGELVALMGPSGSGKTTLLQIAGLLDNPDLGKVLIGEIDASSADDKTRTEIRKNHIGFIYQFHHLLPEFSALENIALPLLIQGKSKAEAYAKAEKMLEEISLLDRKNHRSGELSGGQQQRVAIARAVVAKPSLILADEPTGNLDSELSEKIFALLRDLTKRHEIACLIVTHNFELAKKADRILQIRDGKIA